jgi:hypothetical protein
VRERRICPRGGDPLVVTSGKIDPDRGRAHEASVPGWLLPASLLPYDAATIERIRGREVESGGRLKTNIECNSSPLPISPKDIQGIEGRFL